MMTEAEEIHHRKLIRPSLTAMKEELEQKRRKPPRRNSSQRNASQRNGPPRNAPQKNGPPRAKRSTPADHTNAESFYFVKQMQNQTPMVLVLTDGEQVRGTIEWYDRACVKIRRAGDVNLLVYKESIKYLYKADETDARGPQQTTAQDAAPQETSLEEVDAEDEDEPNGNIAVEAASANNQQ